MKEATLIEALAFLVERRGEDEAAVLTQAVQRGIREMYEEALIEAFLLGQLPRETLLKHLGPERVEEIEYQREALKRDVTWGAQGG